LFHTNNPTIKYKAGLLNSAEELGNLSRACQIFRVFVSGRGVVEFVYVL